LHRNQGSVEREIIEEGAFLYPEVEVENFERCAKALS